MKKSVLVLCVVYILSVGLIGCGKKDTLNNPPMPTTQQSNLNENNVNSTKATSQNIQQYPEIVYSFLKLQAKDTEVIKNLGECTNKSKATVWGADGLLHQTWKYDAKGIELDMVKSNGQQIVGSITITTPCDYKTSKNIGIGSSKQEVTNAYKNEINNEDSALAPSRIVIGSIYGGTIFKFENDKVSSIFVGAAAE